MSFLINDRIRDKVTNRPGATARIPPDLLKKSLFGCSPAFLRAQKNGPWNGRSIAESIQLSKTQKRNLKRKNDRSIGKDSY